MATSPSASPAAASGTCSAKRKAPVGWWGLGLRLEDEGRMALGAAVEAGSLACVRLLVGLVSVRRCMRGDLYV
jgi:hypothetical protein